MPGCVPPRRVGTGPDGGPGMLHHLLAGPSGSTATVVASAGSTPSTLNSDKSNTYDNNVVQRIIGAKAGRPASTAVKAPAEAPAPAVQQVEIDEGSEGQRLDNFLIKLLKGVPKTHVYRVIRSGEVRVNKGRAAADTRLAIGDLVRVPPVRMADPSAVPPAPAREFPVVFEDEHLMAVNKPAGVAVHGGSGVSSGVIEQLRQARPTARFLELVHRLDKETSGLLLIAKKRSALVALQEQFRSRETGKTYAALVVGSWPASRKVIDVALHKFLTGEGERRVRAVDEDNEDGRRSITLVRIAQAYAGFTLLDVTIKTGRTHQIRVHLAHEGHPIAGDEKYGDFAVNKALARGEAVKGVRFERMFLHARRLRFEHPASGEAIELEAPLPAECSSFLQTLPS
jgi:23S rRNA pseudouridine955/2504/2580 synthase